MFTLDIPAKPSYIPNEIEQLKIESPAAFSNIHYEITTSGSFMRFATTSLIKILSCSILTSLLLLAGTTGKITGRIIDDKTGEPVIGSSIIISNSSIGASSDVDGKYLITNVRPGTYSLSISAIGYRKSIVQNVIVNSDFTTQVNIKLSSEAVDLDAVVVTAERPLVRRDLTSTQTSVDASQIKSLPVESVSGILATQAGVVVDAGGALHFRGGRSNEVAYTVNGVSVNNPFTNTNSLTIATNAIQELSVVQGTFNAEYGNALSGVVETGLKEGGESYSGQFTFYGGDRISTHDNIFLNIKDVNPLSHYVLEGTVGGPFPGLEKELSFFVSGRFNREQGWLYGIREHNPSDTPDFSNDQNWKIPMTGDQQLVPMNTSTSWTVTNRFAFKITPSQKIGYDFIFNQDTSQGYSHSFKYNPDGRLRSYSNDVFHSIEYSDLLDQNTTFRLKVAYGRNIRESYRFKDLELSHYEPEENLRQPVSTTFYFGGSSNGRFEQKAETYTFKTDFSSILTNNHEVKAGFEAILPQMYQTSFTVLRDTVNFTTPTIPSSQDYKNNSYARFPKQYSGYVQDKMEFQNIVMNIGLRYDYFISNAKYIVDEFFPEGEKKFAPAKQMISPRIGVSYPITDRGMIHFSYGHFFQMPQLQRLFENADFKTNPTYSSTVFGNANLNPEKTVTYEVGLQQQLNDDLAFNITGFYKDVRDLFSTQTIRISGEKQYSMYVNKDYANIKGFTFSLIKRRTSAENFGFTLDYTLQVAEGNEVSADAFFLDQQSGRESEKIVVPLAWDQEHTLNATAMIGNANDWNVSVISKLGTGLPYTPYVGDNQVTLKQNAGRKPLQFSVDLFAEKEYALADVTLTIFAKIYNLFDRLNEIDVFSDTGRSTYTLAGRRGEGAVIDRHAGSVPGVHSMDEYYNDPTNYSSPREVRIGATINF